MLPAPQPGVAEHLVSKAQGRKGFVPLAVDQRIVQGAGQPFPCISGQKQGQRGFVRLLKEGCRAEYKEWMKKCGGLRGGSVPEGGAPMEAQLTFLVERLRSNRADGLHRILRPGQISCQQTPLKADFLWAVLQCGNDPPVPAAVEPHGGMAQENVVFPPPHGLDFMPHIAGWRNVLDSTQLPHMGQFFLRWFLQEQQAKRQPSGGGGVVFCTFQCPLAVPVGGGGEDKQDAIHEAQCSFLLTSSIVIDHASFSS